MAEPEKTLSNALRKHKEPKMALKPAQPKKKAAYLKLERQISLVADRCETWLVARDGDDGSDGYTQLSHFWLGLL